MDYKKNKNVKKAIAFDFLGVLAKHDGNPFVSEETYLSFEPNQEVIDAMSILKERGFKIILHTTLQDTLVEQYCTKHKVPVDEINRNSDVESGNMGKPVAHVYVDDRAMQYTGQRAEDLAEQISTFKPYWK